MTRFNTTNRTSALVKKGIALAVVATLVSGCMGSAPTVGGTSGFFDTTKYLEVPTADVADGSKSCGAIQQEIAAVDQAIGGVNRKIQASETSKNFMNFLGPLAGLSANQQSALDFGGRQTSNEIYRLKDVKRNYEQRRSTLFKGFVNKGCNG